MDPSGFESYTEARNNAIRKVLEGQRSTGNEHSCMVCSVMTEKGADYFPGPVIKGAEKHVNIPSCPFGTPEEIVHSHPTGAGDVMISGDDARLSNLPQGGSVPVTAVDASGRGSTYTPGGGIQNFNHEF